MFEFEVVPGVEVEVEVVPEIEVEVRVRVQVLRRSVEASFRGAGEVWFVESELEMTEIVWERKLERVWPPDFREVDRLSF